MSEISCEKCKLCLKLAAEWRIIAERLDLEGRTLTASGLKQAASDIERTVKG